ncbi:transcription factor HES-1-A-like [Anoplophora glabripennis]|uniref:transcription factor HES-1-A-like n=1 Tax=Anoplophora glabripennis TaxID=217634 RepID=UPI000C78A65B|nr:transcription factor HES-1-A-like [Anoplophora glabripennis]
MTSEDRKVRKPLMEKKRRARINESLEHLKQFLLEFDPETAMRRNGQRSNKLEKADILELTVRYLQNLRVKVEQNKSCGFLPSTSNWTSRSSFSRQVPVNNTAGGQVFFGIPRQSCQQNCAASETIWRPW